jgi:hypothetical protein
MFTLSGPEIYCPSYRLKKSLALKDIATLISRNERSF